MKEKHKKILIGALIIYSVIAVGCLVVVNVTEDVYNIKLLSYWQTVLLMSPAYAFCAYSLIDIFRIIGKRSRD